MINASRIRTEGRVTEIERRQQKALNEQAQMTREVNANMARLRALRLAKEESDRRAAEQIKTEMALKLAKRRAKPTR